MAEADLDPMEEHGILKGFYYAANTRCVPHQPYKGTDRRYRKTSNNIKKPDIEIIANYHAHVKINMYSLFR